MNLYVRYFDHETLATNMDEVVSFLKSINEIKVDENTINRVMTFAESDGVFPFRLKVSYSNYVLFLKTDAQTLEEFKDQERLRKEQKSEGRMLLSDRKRSLLEALNEPHVGWYDATITFKRVLQNPDTGKCKYVDTRFRAKLIAGSAMHCYERIIDHLQNRQDIDSRSQYPSAKSNNFEYVFLDAPKTNSFGSSNPLHSAKVNIDTQGSLAFTDDAAEFAS